jgi:CMP-N,N'-diacetyllegionaminic acid synthase
VGKCLAVIPARAGSRGIPGKNTKNFLGRPLIEWTIASAIDSNCFDEIIVTTDCSVTRDLSKNYPIKLIYPRPSYLCTSAAPTADVVAHAAEWISEEHRDLIPDLIFVLEPTSPGRQPVHIKNTREVFYDKTVDTVASISLVPHHFAIDKQLRILNDGSLFGYMGAHPRDMIHRRQDIGPSYAFDGVIFACRREVLDTQPPTLWGRKVHSIEVDLAFVVDLDEPHQWESAERKLAPMLL